MATPVPMMIAVRAERASVRASRVALMSVSLDPATGPPHAPRRSTRGETAEALQPATPVHAPSAAHAPERPSPMGVTVAPQPPNVAVKVSVLIYPMTRRTAVDAGSSAQVGIPVIPTKRPGSAAVSATVIAEAARRAITQEGVSDATASAMVTACRVRHAHSSQGIIIVATEVPKNAGGVDTLMTSPKIMVLTHSEM